MHGIQTIITADVAEPLPDDCFKADIAVCSYLFEHLTDAQCKQVILNMAKSAPLNLLIITNKDDERYQEDPTHINAKSNRQWSQMLMAGYKALGWKRIFALRNNWAFASPALAYQFESLPNVFNAAIEKAWGAAR
jgi:hypothetical protein